MLQNIDPVYFTTPVAVMLISFIPVIYLFRKRKLSTRIMFYAFIAYFSAIALKTVVQELTLNYVQHMMNTYLLGFYYGVQTSIFEVGIAYLVVNHYRENVNYEDALGYGLSLGMWENGVLIAIPLLLDYTVYYIMIPRSQELYSILIKEAPSLFLPVSLALQIVGFSILERVSSMLLHISWGYLTVLAALTGRKVYVIYGMAIGFTDFLVPFEEILGLAAFETIVFIMAASAFAFTYYISLKNKKQGRESNL
mgnify:CR=1 FL=1